MNNPEYILTDVIAEIVEATRVALGLANLDFQYGYIEELNETLLQYNKTNEYMVKKFPLIWMRQPYTIDRSIQGFYGSINDLSFFIINGTQKNWKAKDRMTQNFKLVIYPIYREFMKRLNDHIAISYQAGGIPHNFTDNYYWGEAQQSVLSDAVDCSEISRAQIRINNNPNCLPTKSI